MSKIVLVFFLSCLSMGGTLAHASHGTDLRSTAERYRDAASHFGREVIGSREFGVYERRLGYDLLRLSSRMHLYSRTPGLSGRLRDCWWELEDLHQRIEVVLFADPRCPVAVRLLNCYQGLVCAYYDLETALATVGCYHRHGQIHLNHSRVVPILGPNRYYQPTLMDVVLGAVVTGLDASRNERHVRSHDREHDHDVRSGVSNRNHSVPSRHDAHLEHRDHHLDRNRPEPSRTKSNQVSNSDRKGGHSMINRHHALPGSQSLPSRSSVSTPSNPKTISSRVSASRSPNAKPITTRSTSASSRSTGAHSTKLQSSRTPSAQSKEAGKPAGGSGAKPSSGGSDKRGFSSYFRGGKILEEYSRKREDK